MWTKMKFMYHLLVYICTKSIKIYELVLEITKLHKIFCFIYFVQNTWKLYYTNSTFATLIEFIVLSAPIIQLQTFWLHFVLADVYKSCVWGSLTFWVEYI